MTDFSDLEPFIHEWGLASAHDRLGKRMAATMDELHAFHSAMAPRLSEIIEFLNQYPLNAIPAEYQPLAYAALAVCEVDDPIHMWHAPTLELASDLRTWKVKKNLYDHR